MSALSAHIEPRRFPMPIAVSCSQCGCRLKAADQLSGKATKCPKCQGRIEVPKTAEEAGNWFLKTEDGADYGPVPKAELDGWFRDGRVTADCQLLRQGADQWQWGSDVYPSLDAEPTPAPAPTPKPPTVAKPPSKPRPGTLTPLPSLQPAPAALQPLAPAPDIFSELASQSAMLPPAPVYPGYAPPNPYGAAPPSSPMAAAYGVYGGGGYGGGSYGRGSYGGSGLGIPGIAIAVAILNFIQALWCFGNGIMALVQCLPYLMNPNQPPPKEIAGNREMLAKWGPEMATMVGGISIVFAIFIFTFALLFLWAGVSIFLRKQAAITVNNILAGLAVLWVLFGVLAFLQTTSPLVIVSTAFNLVYLIAVFASMNGKDVEKAMKN